MSNNVLGVESLLKKLNKLGGNVEDVLSKSIEKQTKLVQGEAKMLCPVDLSDLRNSIKTKVTITNKKIVGIIYTNSDHAAYVEFGTGKKGQDTPVSDKYPGTLSYKQDKWRVNIPDVGVRWIEGQPAQPYMYPALKNSKAKILENIRQDVIKAIKGVANQ